MLFTLISVLPLFSAFTINDESTIIDYTNNYRNLHQAPNVIYDNNIGSNAQIWSDNLASLNSLAHSSTNYGENLAQIGFITTPNHSQDIQFIKKAIDIWYNESLEYNYNNPGFSSNTGHFTQLVWINTQSIGVGISFSNTYIFIVMQFSLRGNYRNDFAINVKPILLTIPSPISPSPIISLPSPPAPVTPSPSPPVAVTPLPSPPAPLTPSPSPPVAVTPLPSPPVPIVPLLSPPAPLTPVLLTTFIYVKVLKSDATILNIINILCPLLTNGIPYNSITSCRVLFQSTTGIYYGMLYSIDDLYLIRNYIQQNNVKLTADCNFYCGNTIAIGKNYWNNTEKLEKVLFRGKSSQLLC
jgi:hypothetical protein